MYVSVNYRRKDAHYIDMKDRDFFAACTAQAVDRMDAVAASGLGTDELKPLCPVCMASKLKGQVAAEAVVDRRYLNGDRARRSYVMGDVDYGPEEAAAAQALREALVRFAERMRTPLLIYPTLSYPDKPRFRWVMFPKRTLDAAGYHKAVTWVYEQVGFAVTDKSDLLMTTNRNLPMFSCREQVEAVHSTLGDRDLVPLDNSLWRDVPAPKRRKPRAAYAVADHARPLDGSALLEAASALVEADSRELHDYWPFLLLVRGFAAAEWAGGCGREDALACLEAFASVASNPHEARRWREGNVSLYLDELARMDGNVACSVRPLSLRCDFADAVAKEA